MSQNILNLIDELKNKIENSTLTIEGNLELQNIEFIHDFEIEELTLDKCINVIPKLNSHHIKKISFYQSNIKYLHDLQLPNLEELTLFDELDQEDRNKVLQSIRQFEKLKKIKLWGYYGLDLKLILQRNITSLWLTGCTLTNIELLSQFTELTSLSLAEYQNLNIKPLSSMLQLTKLNIPACGLNDISSLRFLINIKELNLSVNDIDLTQIYLLQNFKQLSILILNLCSLIDLIYLKPLSNLKELDISMNNIVYLEPLQNLNNIVSLNTQINKVLDVSVLKNHPNFSSYELDYQDQPTLKEIMFANKLRDINAQVTSLRNIREYHSNVKSKMVLQNKKIDNSLQQIFNTQTQFIQQVASSFQKQSSLEGYQ
ncbi:leucine_Rich Repeat (LRR)-containing protein [Hexamita inflata]|uniref:Partial n=1 Tax=Hexamita inflata TaxID=28002 RepID=A0AA86QI34_9EUKA|nr:leucine Rich Repeat (LRR)-containing protein [Hexamita inflata]